MTLLATAFLWLLQSTAAGLVALALPRLFRLTSPAWLVSWWGGVAGSVVLLPLGIALMPEAPAGRAVVASVVESTAAVLGPSTHVFVMPVGTLLVALWVAGTCARLGWLWMGLRRLRRLVATGRPVSQDEALTEALRLVDVRVPLEVLEVDGVGPCAQGWLPVRVIVPPTLREQPYQQRLGVYLHELLHVARWDVHRTYGDEVWRAIWWWQPAVWWALARLRLAREQGVDAQVVRLTGAMRDYVDALLWCSAQPSATAPTLHAGGRRHVLVRRVALMCKEESMSRMRGGLVTAAMLAVLGTVSGSMAYVAPLDIAAPTGQDGDDRAGGLEQVAVHPTLDVPAPRRVRAVAPAWTPPAGTAFSMRVNAVVDATGRVAEARILGIMSASGRIREWPIAPDDAHAAVLDAVRQWEFDPPLQSPMLLTTDVVLGDPALLMAAKITTGPQRVQGPQGMQEKILRAGGTIPPPRKVYDVPPVYPAVAMDAKVQGVVVIECTVGTDGAVTDTNVVRSIPLLDHAAVESVRQWRYTPTLLNGEAVPIIVTVTVNFTLK